ncbi:hypothetical protein PQ478_08575 [Alkalihalophilus pseudofirmus]|uniref:hypothetical protein n=1 Tax=Alkalihalophilus pseudofirmus TaxID=79885 RepID=UPI00259B6A8B|nr:hypothetical protein [Alkalihalophilus pseudofirmus]WEG18523.1 hypothetical protein PQ478_08575 [Alkalihalophilus pseudofirmus]
MDYFEAIVGGLTIEELSCLGLLQEEDANAPFKAIPQKTLREELNLTTANFRRVILSLEAKQLIKVMRDRMKHNIYITHYGVDALTLSLEGVE